MTEASPMSTGLRTHQCGALRLDHVEQSVRLGGWVHRSRNLGGLVFVDLRDRTGLVQVSFDPAIASPETLDAARSLGSESVVLITGDVTARPPEMRNKELETGDIEITGQTLRIVGPAETPVIPVARTRATALSPLVKTSCGSIRRSGNAARYIRKNSRTPSLVGASPGVSSCSTKSSASIAPKPSRSPSRT